MNGILILEVGEYRIEYNPRNQMFYIVKDGEELTSENTQKDCEKYIEADKKKRRSFEPFTVISPSEKAKVKITSQDAHDSNEVWVSETRRGRGKYTLSSQYGAAPHYYFFEDNDYNGTILGTILDLEKTINQCSNDIDNLSKQFTNPITQEYIEKRRRVGNEQL